MKFFICDINITYIKTKISKTSEQLKKTKNSEQIGYIYINYS